MSPEDALAELERRRSLALQMGGAEQVARQHEHGKLTARERLAGLADEGSFREFGGLAGSGTYQDGQLASFTPKGEVTGFVSIGGRRAVVAAGDFTVRGGSGRGSSGGLGQELSASRRALEWQVPYVRLLDASGGSVAGFADIGRTYLPDGNTWAWIDVQLLQAVPVVSAVMGSVAGLPAVNACMSHFNVMVRGTAQLFPVSGGPRRPRGQGGGDRTLTQTEVRLIQLLRQGLTNRQISAVLHYSAKTIEVYLSRLYQKAGYHSRLELVLAAERGELGVLPPEPPQRLAAAAATGWPRTREFTTAPAVLRLLALSRRLPLAADRYAAGLQVSCVLDREIHFRDGMHFSGMGGRDRPCAR